MRNANYDKKRQDKVRTMLNELLKTPRLGGIAKETRISQVTLSRFKNNKMFISQKNLEKLEKCLENKSSLRCASKGVSSLVKSF